MNVKSILVKLSDAIRHSQDGEYVYHSAGYYLQNGKIKRMDGQSLSQKDWDNVHRLDKWNVEK